MPRNGPPNVPKPLIRPPNGKPYPKKEKIEYIKYCIQFYIDRLYTLEEPFIFKRKYKKEVKRIQSELSTLEYTLLTLTNPEIIDEINNMLYN